jgi:hypothetical protein
MFRWPPSTSRIDRCGPDAESGHGKLNGSPGFTVVYTYETFGIEAFFTGVGAAKIGDRLYRAPGL